MSTSKKRARPGAPRQVAAAPRQAARARWATWGQPPELHAVRPVTDRLVLAAVVLVLLVVYALSTPRTVLLEDDGLFLMSAATLGVSHPPGYPLHTLLGWLFAHLPFGTMAFRVHFLSGVLGAASCGALGWIVLRRTGNRAAAVAAALAYGVSEHFWSQAILAEVYTFNALFFFTILALVIEAAAHPTGRLLLGVAALYGLSLANHWPLTILATPAFALALSSRWREVARELPRLGAVTLACAAVPYAWMVWRSNQDPLISFYGPIDSWRDFWFYVGRRGYARIEASPTAGMADKLQFAAYFLREAVRALTPIGLGFALAGLVRDWRAGPRLGLVGEVGAFVASSLFLALLLGFDFGFLKVAVFRPYPLVAYGLLALWMGSGLALTARWLASRGRWLAPAAALPMLLLPAFLAWHNWPVSGRARDDFADRQARAVLDVLPPEAVLLVYSDSDTAPIGYLHVVEGVRPDVSLYNMQGLVFRDRLMPALASPRIREERLAAFISGTPRPVYHMTDKILPPQFAEEHLGFVKRVLAGEKPGRPRPRYEPKAADFFRELMAMGVSPDRWVRTTRNQLVHRYANFLSLAQLDEDADLRQRVAPLVALAQEDYYGLTGMSEVLVEHGTTRETWERAAAYLERAERLRDDSLDSERLGREHYLRGFTAFRLGDTAGAEAAFRRSVAIYPNPENGSHLALAQLAQLRGARPGQP